MVDSRRVLALLLLIAAGFAALLCVGLAELWLDGHHGFNGALHGQIARNYLRYGFLDTELAPIKSWGEVPPDRYLYHWHHPVLINVLVALSFLVFGVHEWAARLVPILCSLGSLFLLFTQARRYWGKTAALLTVFLFAFSPMSLTYGHQVNYEPVLLFFCLLAFEAFTRWSHGGRRWNLLLLALPIAGAAFIDWPAFLFAMAFALVLLPGEFLAGGGRRVFALLFPVGVLLLAFLVVLHLASFSGTPGNLWRTFLWRAQSSRGIPDLAPYTLEMARRLWVFFTPLCIVLTLVWLGVMVRRTFTRHLTAGDRFLLVWLLFGLLHQILFPHAAWFHTYWHFYWLPLFSGASAVVLTHPWLRERLHETHMARRKLVSLAWGVVCALALLLLFLAPGLPVALEQRRVQGAGFRRYRPHLERSLLGKHLHQQTSPTDCVILQRGLRLGPQFKYYLDREMVVMDASRTMSRGQRKCPLWILPRRMYKHPEVSKSLFLHPADVFEGYLIIDSREGGFGTTHYRIRQEPAGWWWRYSRSLVYGPYLVEEVD